MYLNLYRAETMNIPMVWSDSICPKNRLYASI